MGLTPAEFNSFLRSLYPNQSAAASFHLYTADRRKELVKVEGGQDTLYGYSGVVFIKVSVSCVCDIVMHHLKKISLSELFLIAVVSPKTTCKSETNNCKSWPFINYYMLIKPCLITAM